MHEQNSEIIQPSVKLQNESQDKLCEKETKKDSLRSQPLSTGNFMSPKLESHMLPNPQFMYPGSPHMMVDTPTPIMQMNFPYLLSPSYTAPMALPAPPFASPNHTPKLLKPQSQSELQPRSKLRPQSELQPHSELQPQSDQQSQSQSQSQSQPNSQLQPSKIVAKNESPKKKVNIPEGTNNEETKIEIQDDNTKENPISNAAKLELIASEIKDSLSEVPTNEKKYVNSDKTPNFNKRDRSTLEDNNSSEVVSTKPKKKKSIGEFIHKKSVASKSKNSKKKTSSISSINGSKSFKEVSNNSSLSLRTSPIPQELSESSDCQNSISSATLNTETLGPTLTHAQMDTVKWQNMFFELVLYKHEKGDCNVPVRYVTKSKNDGIGLWVQTVRSQYKLKKRNPKKQIFLSDDHIEALNEIGFVWDVREEQWDKRFQQLVAYKEKYGDCNVPTAKSDLGRWVNAQRVNYHDKLTKIGTAITQAHIDRLESIGFVWKFRTTMCWEDRFKQLEEFKKEHGHIIVPQHYEKDHHFGRWVSKQREQYRLLQDGKPSQITEERIKRLNSLGMVWNAKKWRDMRKKYSTKDNQTASPPHNMEESKLSIETSDSNNKVSMMNNLDTVDKDFSTQTTKPLDALDDFDSQRAQTFIPSLHRLNGNYILSPTQQPQQQQQQQPPPNRDYIPPSQQFNGHFPDPHILYHIHGGINSQQSNGIYNPSPVDHNVLTADTEIMNSSQAYQSSLNPHDNADTPHPSVLLHNANTCSQYHEPISTEHIDTSHTFTYGATV